MAYATGSAADISALLNAVQGFAAARGWTIDKYEGSPTPASNLLFLHKGVCFVAFQGRTENVTRYETGAGVVDLDYQLLGSLSTSITGALTNFYGHPGSIVSGAAAAERVQINDLEGPFDSYHLFSDAGGDHIHVAVQTGSDRWQHFSFGMVDQGDLTHGGCAYLTGVSRTYWRNTLDLNSVSSIWNDISKISVPFSGNEAVSYSASVYQTHCPDALPATADWPVIAARDHLPLLVGKATPADFPLTSSVGRLNTALVRNPTSQWGGNVPLWMLPVIRLAPDISKACYVGDFPDVRLVNLEALQAQQEIELGSDVWKVFPVGRQTAWGSRAQTGAQFASGQYGIAYKKVA